MEESNQDATDDLINSDINVINELSLNSQSANNVVTTPPGLFNGSAFNMVKSGGKKLGVAAIFWILGYLNLSVLWIVFGVLVALYMAEKGKKSDASSMILQKAIDNPKDFVQAVAEVYHLNGKKLPSWIYYPDVEKADWLNKIIQKMWPYIGSYVKNMLTTEVQQKIQESHPLLSNFTFTDVDLGERAPRTTGIKVHGDAHTRKNEIVIDMQLIYDGDCDFGIAVKFLEAGIKDFRLRGLLRIELKPLLAKVPLVGAVSVAFVKDPIIDFNLTELGNFLDFPGFSFILRDAVADSIGSILVLPERYIYKLSPDVDTSRLRFPLPKGVIRIHVIEAESLAEKDSFLGVGRKSDPFVTIKGFDCFSTTTNERVLLYRAVYHHMSRGRLSIVAVTVSSKPFLLEVGHQNKFQTRTIKSTVNPKWNETFDALVRYVQYGNIEFDVYDDDGALMKADYLGKIVISIKSIYDHGVIDEAIELLQTDTGKLHLRLEWYDLLADPKVLEEIEKEFPKNSSSCSLFCIYVDCANHLPVDEESNQNPSPYLTIDLPQMETLKTKVIEDTVKPCWEENFRVFLNQPWDTEAVFVVEDEMSRKQLGILKFNVKDLLKAPNLIIEKEFPLENSSEKAMLKLRMSLRIMKLKPQSPSSDNVGFAVSSRNKSAIKSNDSEDSDLNSLTHSTEDSLVSETISTSITDDVAGSSSQTTASNINRTNYSSNSSEPGVLRKRLPVKVSDLNGSGDAQNRLGRIKLTICYRSHFLVVIVVAAENLIAYDDENQTSDPYVKLYVIPNKSQKKKTSVIKNSVNPTFDERFEFDIPPEEAACSKLKVSVKNETSFFSREKTKMGQIIVNLADLDLTQPNTRWYNLILPENR